MPYYIPGQDWRTTYYNTQPTAASPILESEKADYIDPEIIKMKIAAEQSEKAEKAQEYEAAKQSGRNHISRIAESIWDDYGQNDYTVPEEEKKYRGTKGYNKGVVEGLKNTATGYLTVASLPLMASEVATYGLLGGLGRLAGGTVGSTIGSTALGTTGDYVDHLLGTQDAAINFGGTGRFVGGLAGIGAGMGATTSILRRLATKGITLHMPWETFMKLRSEGFHKNANRVVKSLFKTKHNVNPEERLMNEITDVSKAKGWQFHIDDFYKQPNIDLETGRPISTSFNKQYYENGLIKPGKSYIDPSGESDYIWFKEDTPYIKPKHSNIIKGLSEDLNTKTNQLVSGEPNLFPLSKGFDPNKSSIEIYEYYPLGNIKMNPKLHLKDQSVGTWGKVKFHIPNQPQPSATTYEVRSLRVPKYRPITEAERLGYPKAMRYDYGLTAEQRAKVIADANEFAKKYGYSEIKDTPEALQQIQDMYRRHNTFGRVITDADEFNPIWHHFGKEHAGLTSQQRAELAAIEGYPYAWGEPYPQDRVFVSGNQESLLNYGSESNPAFAVRRRISLGHNPLKWRENSEFTLQDWSKEMHPGEVRQTSGIPGQSSEIFLGTGTLSAKPLTSPEQLSGAFNTPIRGQKTTWLKEQGFGLPRKHLQGEDAVQMFKEYGSVQIPENSKIIEQLRKYVPEARERYGLVGNTNITDDEIAGSLYKKALELGGDTAAVNEVGEPLVLFRGDTKRYLALKPRMSPEELSTKRGTMDNSLGTLFLDYPTHYQGVDRYLGTIRNFNGEWEYLNSGTGSRIIGGERPFDPIEKLPEGAYNLYSGLFGKQQTPIQVWKLPGNQMENGVNDLNGFVVRTKSVRDATPEISVLNDYWLAKGAVGSKPHMKTILIEDEHGFPLFKHPDGSVTEALAGMENRPGMAEHYRFVLDDAKSKEQGLLWSRSGAPLRDEHTNYNYYALPNFNILGAKHLLPYDFRIKPRWGSKLIYRKQGGILKAQNGNIIPMSLLDYARRQAYKIVTDPNVWWRCGANLKDIVKNVFRSKPVMEDQNKAEFLFGVKRPETTDGQAYDWENDIKENKYKNVKSYEGTLNPYNEYVLNDRDKGLVKELAKSGYTTFLNINDEYSDPKTERINSDTPYFDDVHNYRIRFHNDENGNPVISASDLYDFGKNYSRDFKDLNIERGGNGNLEWQRKLLNLVGQPYKLVQHNIPIRFTDNPQENEIQRVNSFTRQVLDKLSDEDIAKITDSGLINPATITNKQGGVLKAQSGIPNS